MKSKYGLIKKSLLLSLITTFLITLLYMIILIVTGAFDYLYMDEILALGIIIPIFESIVFFIPNFLGSLLSIFIDQKVKDKNRFLFGLLYAISVMIMVMLIQSFDIVYGWKKIVEKINDAIILGSLDSVIFYVVYLLLTRKSRKVIKNPE